MGGHGKGYAKGYYTYYDMNECTGYCNMSSYLRGNACCLLREFSFLWWVLHIYGIVGTQGSLSTFTYTIRSFVRVE